MKRVKRIASLLLAMVMVLGMGVTSFAANTNKHTITITNEKDGHTYTAYQIFAGDLFTNTDGKQVLSNIEWGSGITTKTDTDKETALLKELKAEVLFEKNDVNVFAEAANAADVAAALNGFTDKQMDKFSEIIGDYLADQAGVSTVAKSPYTIDVTGDGYYFVKDTGTIAEGDAETRYILQVVADVNVAAKADAPGVDKNILTNLTCNNTAADHKHTINCYDGKVKFNNAAIGDTVPFVVDSKVPNMDGYEEYFFVIQDKLPEGFNFNADVAVTIGSKNLSLATAGAESESYYLRLYNTAPAYADNGVITTQPFKVITSEAELGALTETERNSICAFEVVFNNFLQYQTIGAGTDEGAKKITVTYSAVVNEKVQVGTTGEINEVKLVYSKNPNTVDGGTPNTPDYPSPNAPTGDTPKSQTCTYTTGIQLKKIDGTTNAALPGAQFTITADVLNQVLVNKTEYVERTAADTDPNNVYYLLKDGTYTATAPVFNADDATKDTSKYYEHVSGGAVTKTYKLVESTGLTKEPSEEVEIEVNGSMVTTRQFTAYVDDNGLLNLAGLPAGTYTISEIKAPNGYNLLTDPITIVIEWAQPSADSTDMKCVWTVKKDGEALSSEDVNGKALYKFTVENQKGSLLPSTGGIGTTIFYVIGGILVIGAGILLVTKKRMSVR